MPEFQGIAFYFLQGAALWDGHTNPPGGKGGLDVLLDYDSEQIRQVQPASALLTTNLDEAGGHGNNNGLRMCQCECVPIWKRVCISAMAHARERGNGGR